MDQKTLSIRLHGSSAAAGLTVLAIGLLVLVGWRLDVVVLKSLYPGWIPMAPASALAFALAGAGLAAVAVVPHSPSRLRRRLQLATYCAAAGLVLISTLRLGEYLSLWTAHIDFLWFDVNQKPDSISPARPMAPATALGFLLMGATLWLQTRPTYPWAFQILPILTAAIGWLGLATYFYGGLPLLPIAGMAAHSACCFLALGTAALWARTDDGLGMLLTSESVGGKLARRLLPPVLLLPVSFDLLRSCGVRWGWYGLEGGQALVSLLTAVVFGFIVWGISVRLRRSDLERRRIESERARLAAILESSDDAVIATSMDGHIAAWNAGAEHMFGYAASEALGQPIGMTTPEELAGEEAQLYERIAQGEHIELPEVLRIRKDGTRFPAWLKVSPVLDADGTQRYVSLIARDLTRIKQAEFERQKLQGKIEQIQKMESIGRLAGGIAHDFNNLLTVIVGYSQFALKALPEGDEIRGDIEEIERAGKRAAELTRQLLAFSRDQVMKTEVFSLNDVITQTERMLGRLIGEDIEIELRLAKDLHRVRADATQVEQVIMNLAVNARDAMPTGGRLVIETHNVSLGGLYAEDHFSIEPGEYIQLSVTDTGCGMTEATRRRIFEPFFTTKSVGKGTGLGLATVYGIVKQSGGTVWVYSEVGKGTVFKVYLPSTAESATTPMQAAPMTAIRSGASVLLVEDDDALRSFAQRALQAAGFKVLSARSGNEALGVLQHYDGPMDVMITDVVMPGMSGRDLAKRVEQKRPNVKVLYMSGYNDDTIVRNGVYDGEILFIPKPFNANDLAHKVNQALAGVPKASNGSSRRRPSPKRLSA